MRSRLVKRLACVMQGDGGAAMPLLQLQAAAWDGQLGAAALPVACCVASECCGSCAAQCGAEQALIHKKFTKLPYHYCCCVKRRSPDGR
jgi:hypothetical protein